MKLAVIGGGIIGIRHLEAAQLVDGLQPSAVVELNPVRAAELNVRFGIRTYSSYEEMLEAEKPDIAVVALPHYLHMDAAVRCAERGTHILLEKPMALTVKECDTIIEAARRYGVTLMVGHTQHYHPENIAAKRIIDSGELGELVMINDVRHVHYYRDDRPGWFFEKAKSGGGILTNLGAHSVDKIQWMTGSSVAKVKAAVSRYGGRGDVEGSGLVMLETASGIPATIAQSGYPGASRNETEFIFTKGMLRLETGKGLAMSRGGSYEPVAVEGMEQPFVRQFRDLLSAIERGAEPECSGTYSRTVIAALEAIYESAETGTERLVSLEG